MKSYKATLISVALILLMLITVMACNGSQESNINSIYVFEGSANAGIYKSQPTDVEINIDLPTLPDRLMAYQITNQEITEKYADELAAKLGFSEKWPLYGGKRVAYSYTKDKMSLEIGLEGGIRFSNSEIDNLSNLSPNLPEDSECIKIAKDWLMSYDLYPFDVVKTEVKYGSSTIRMDLQTGKPTSPVYDSKRVNFITNINSYEAYTPFATVLVGDQGTIGDVSIIKMEFKESGLVFLKTSQKALEILKAYLARLTPIAEEAPECTYNTDGTRVIINSVSIQYTRTFKTGYILPICVFEGDVYDGTVIGSQKFIGSVDIVDHPIP